MKERKVKGPRFDINNPKSFYINTETFKDTNLFPTIELLSKNSDELYKIFITEKRKDRIDNDFYYYFQTLYDYPIIKLSENTYCISDIKFLVENICSGFRYKVLSLLKGKKAERFKTQYGYLMEEYFCFLMKEIFGKKIELKYKEEGAPDAILKIKNGKKKYKLIIEFTTNYYKIASLYNKSDTEFYKDLDELLFYNERGDAGKFIKLNKYLNEYKENNYTLIPIIVTENWTGDFDLLNLEALDLIKKENKVRYNYLNKKIKQHSLSYLVDNKPYILSLNDMETFWAISSPGREGNELINLLLSWKKVDQVEKFFKYHYSFATYVAERKRKNPGYNRFFNEENLKKWNEELINKDKK